MRVSDPTGWMTLVFFGRFADQLEQRHPVGARRIISGKVEDDKFGRQMVHPDYMVDPGKDYQYRIILQNEQLDSFERDLFRDFRKEERKEDGPASPEAATPEAAPPEAASPQAASPEASSPEA